MRYLTWPCDKKTSLRIRSKKNGFLSREKTSSQDLDHYSNNMPIIIIQRKKGGSQKDHFQDPPGYFLRFREKTLAAASCNNIHKEKE